MLGRIIKRLLCSQRVSVSCAARDGWWQTIPANLEEIEEGSCLVLSEASISVGKKVRVCCGIHQLNGTVTASLHNDILGFFVEVQFDSDSQWSERRFKPQHMLTPTPRVALRAAG